VAAAQVEEVAAAQAEEMAAASKSAEAEPLVQEMNERVAAATAAGKEGKTGAGFDLLTEAGMKLEHLELEALLASIAPLVVLAALVCHGCLELAVVGSKQWLG
jgi:hypothetical protein